MTISVASIVTMIVSLVLIWYVGITVFDTIDTLYAEEIINQNATTALTTSFELAINMKFPLLIIMTFMSISGLWLKNNYDNQEEIPEIKNKDGVGTHKQTYMEYVKERLAIEEMMR